MASAMADGGRRTADADMGIGVVAPLRAFLALA
jgi:hypothetical protein